MSYTRLISLKIDGYFLFQEEMDDCLVIIFIAETDPENVFQISSEIQGQFSKHLESGTLPFLGCYHTVNKVLTILYGTLFFSLIPLDQWST